MFFQSLRFYVLQLFFKNLLKAYTDWLAEPEQDWRIINWNKEIELFEGISINLGDYLAKMNVELE